MKYVTLLVKPASGRCNLRCRYCFYEDVSGHRQEYDLGLMPEETLELLVRQTMDLAQEGVNIGFQGGEPMLRGLPFYRKLLELEQRYQKPGVTVSHTIQTNGTLITPEWAEFFRDNRFLVGLSLDGLREIHNDFRVDPRGKGSWPDAVRGLDLLKKAGAEVNLLCVVTGAVARRGQAVYQNLKKLGVPFLQFIPCLDPMEGPRGQWPFSLTPQRYETFLKTVFDLWYQDWAGGHYVSVRLFDDYVNLLAGRGAGTCATTGSCGQYFVIEGDGSVYPCDFFVLDHLRLGKLGEQTLAEMAASPVAQEFCTRGHGHPAQCEGCPWLPLCRGGCQRDWDGDRNYQCPALKGFFEYAYPRLNQIAQMERREMERRRR